MNPAAERWIGRYRVESELGRGGMGAVYRASDPFIARSVAIKVVRLEDLGSSDDTRLLQQRLVSEMRLAGSLSHANIVPIYDVGAQDGTVYMVMELVEGRSLEELLAAGTPVDLSATCAILKQIAAALDYLHAHDIVHRDLKPANILINDEQVAKLTDFGIARILSSPRLTRTGLLVGTPHYMSPEQLTAGSLRGASDQFGLAVIAWRMLTGQRPFDAEDISRLACQIVEGTPASPPAWLGIDPRTERVLRRALAKEPNWRYPSCCEFVAALERSEQVVPAANRRSSWLPAALSLSVAAITIMLAPRPPEPSADSVPAAGSRMPPSPLLAPDEPSVAAVPVPVSSPRATGNNRVRVNSSPAGATVGFDQDPAKQCVAPCSIDLSPGRHTILAKLSGYRTARRIFSLPSEPVPFIILEPERAMLMIATTPPGATILIDGRTRRETTPAALSLPPGTYEVQVTHEDSAGAVSRISLLDGATRKLEVNFEESVRPPRAQ